MKTTITLRSLALFAATLALVWPLATISLAADPTGGKIKHILILMLENRSFDSYLGQLATKGVYQRPSDTGCDYASGANCTHTEVDGLDCTVDSSNNYSCPNNFNPKGFIGTVGTSSCMPDPNAGNQTAFHDPSYCTADTNHEWDGTHHEFNQCFPAASVGSNDGFYVQNLTAVDRLMTDGLRTQPERTMGFYDNTDLPFYYSLADQVAIGDRYFCSILGPTIPNRMYLMAATSFGHIHTTNDLVPPPGGNTPVTGNIFKSLNAANVTWKNYFHDVPQAGLFDVKDASPTHFADINELFIDLATPAETDALGPVAPLPQVAFIDPPFTQPQVILPDASLNFFSGDEHPPKDIQFGQQLAARVVNAVLSSPHYADTVLFITYDEHGGFYDHVPPPLAPDPGDGHLPGDCPDSSFGLLAPTGDPLDAVRAPLAAQYKANFCKGSGEGLTIPFNHLGIRVPFYVVSPYAKRHYVSHTVLDHTSLLRFIEERFGLGVLTARDAAANLPLDVFDFETQNVTPVTLTQPGLPKLDPLLDPHCYEGVELF
jgi:phospholipase C